MRFFQHFQEVALVNAYLLYNEVREATSRANNQGFAPIRMLRFRTLVVEALADGCVLLTIFEVSFFRDTSAVLVSARSFSTHSVSY